jgi:hypothetical protein
MTAGLDSSQIAKASTDPKADSSIAMLHSSTNATDVVDAQAAARGLLKVSKTSHFYSQSWPSTEEQLPESFSVLLEAVS